MSPAAAPDDELAYAGFAAHWGAVGADVEAAARAHRALLDAWDEPHRAYHTREHLRACIRTFDALSHAFAAPSGAALALWYHDAVYDPRRADNEARSADLARGDLGAAGARPEAVERIAALIDATRHATEPADPDARLVVDIDLGILAAPPARYARYEAEIRREYAWVPEALFREKRAAILRRFLEGPIYGTVWFADREAAARANLAGAIARLEEG